MNQLRNFLRTFERTLSYVLVVLLTLILFTQIINRYIFSTSFVWLEEIARICFVWLIYFCIASAARENSHIRVGLVDLVVPRSWVRIFDYIADVLVIAFSLIIVWLGIELMLSTIAYGERTSVTEIPMAVIYAVIPFCFALIVIRIIGYNLRQLRVGKPGQFKEGDQPSGAFRE